MSLVSLGIAYVIVVLAGLLLIAELRTGCGGWRLGGRSRELYCGSGEAEVLNSIGLPVDAGHGYGGSCGGFGSGGGGSCDGGGHGG